MRITYIEYNPPGLDSEGEYVDIRNFDTSVANLANWTLGDESNNVFTFPAFSLLPSASVRVWVRSGVNDGLNLYWGRDAATWNNNGDTATLRNSGDDQIDTCTYLGGGEGVFCE